MRSPVAILALASMLLSAQAFAPSYNNIRSPPTFAAKHTSLEAKKTEAELARMKELQAVDAGGLFKAFTYLGASVVALGLILGPGAGDLPSLPSPSFSPQASVSKAAPKTTKKTEAAAKKQVKKLKDKSGYDLTVE